MGKEGEPSPQEPQAIFSASGEPGVWVGKQHTVIVTEAGESLAIHISKLQTQEMVVIDFRTLQDIHIRSFPQAASPLPAPLEAAPPLPAQTAALPEQPQHAAPQEQPPTTEKEPTIIVTGTFVKDIAYRQVTGKNKQTQLKELQWLYKFQMLLPGNTPQETRMQIVASLGKAAERQKRLDLQPNEEIEVKGYMQKRKNNKTGEETEDLFAITIRRPTPPPEQPNA